MGRFQLNKLTHSHSTKPERQFAETLKKYHVPFRTKIKIAGREIDFLIGKHAVEIDGHPQDVSKNKLLIEKGYYPIHLFNSEAKSEVMARWFRKIYGRNKSIRSAPHN